MVDLPVVGEYELVYARDVEIGDFISDPFGRTDFREDLSQGLVVQAKGAPTPVGLIRLGFKAQNGGLCYFDFPITAFLFIHIERRRKHRARSAWKELCLAV